MTVVSGLLRQKSHGSSLYRLVLVRMNIVGAHTATPIGVHDLGVVAEIRFSNCSESDSRDNVIRADALHIRGLGQIKFPMSSPLQIFCDVRLCLHHTQECFEQNRYIITLSQCEPHGGDGPRRQTRGGTSR